MPSGAPRRLLALAAGATLAVGLAGPARAATPGAVPSRLGTFGLSPATHELRGTPGQVLTPSEVENRTSGPLHVRVIPVLLRQTRSGAFAFLESAAAQAAARRVLAVSATGFSIPAGTQHTVLERWKRSAGRRPAYPGVVFRVAPHERGGAVHTVAQLLQINLLGLRGDGPPRGRIAGLSVFDGTRRHLDLVLGLANVGRSFGTPSRLGLLVRDGAGRTVARAGMLPGVIIPGATRDFRAQLSRRLPAGRYTAVATARLGVSTRSRTLRFRVASDGLLPEASLVAGPVRSHGTVGAHADVTVALRNQGTRAGGPRGTVSLYAMHTGVADRRPLARMRLTGPAVSPGRTGTEHLALGRLRAGAYQTIVRYSPPFVPTDPVYVDFAPRPSTSLTTAIARWIGAHLAMLAMAGVLVGSLGYSRRRVRRATARPRDEIRLGPLP